MVNSQNMAQIEVNCLRIFFIQKRCCLNICLVGRLLFFALIGQHFAFVFFCTFPNCWCQVKFLTSHHVQMLRILLYILQRNLVI